MIIKPIIPIWLMLIISILLIILILKNQKLKISRILIVILLFIISLRPMIPSNTLEKETSNLNVLFVIDTTISMNAKDNEDKSRIARAKTIAQNIMKELNGASFSIIKFDNNARTIIPYTKNMELVYSTLKNINTIDYVYAKGSSLNNFYDDTLKSLKNSSKNKEKITVIYLISDGENTDDSTPISFSKMKKYVKSGAVIGVGSKSGSTIPYKLKYVKQEDYIYYNGKKAKSKLDEKNLKKISKDMGVKYIDIKNENAIKNNLSEIKKLESKKINKEDETSNDDIYYILVIPLILLVFYNYINIRRLL